MKTIFTISRIFTESICMDILQQVNWTELFPLIALLSFLFGINVAVNVAMQLLENLCWTQTATVCSLLLLSGFGFSSARLLVDAPAPPVSAVHLFNISSQSCRVKKQKKEKKQIPQLKVESDYLRSLVLFSSCFSQRILNWCVHLNSLEVIFVCKSALMETSLQNELDVMFQWSNSLLCVSRHVLKVGYSHLCWIPTEMSAFNFRALNLIANAGWPVRINKTVPIKNIFSWISLLFCWLWSLLIRLKELVVLSQSLNDTLARVRVSFFLTLFIIVLQRSAVSLD